MKNDGAQIVQDHPVVSHEAWLEARRALLAQEKELTRLRDQVSEQRRALPWEAVTKPYRFDGPGGTQTLAELFGSRSQLVVYHAMFDPERAGPGTSWTASAACHGCSFWMDHFDGILPHLAQRDVTLVAVSRGPYSTLAAYQQRMGWRFPWWSSRDSDFNADFGVSFTSEQIAGGSAMYNFALQDPELSEREGVSVFYRDGAGRVFHTYSAYARGIDALNVAYQVLDLVPKGRDEQDRGPYWVKRRDEYGDTGACCH
jgi:predicted dithiol-disulfide oxidoreductase (DUF899 family)